MKVLVLGAAGMAGHVMCLYFKEQGHQVTGISRRHISYCENIILDLNHFEQLKTIIDQGKFDVIINCAGILNTNVDKDLAEGIFINSYLPHKLAEILADTQTKLIHLSTDCVFSGKSGNYTEDTYKDADSFYGRTKALGEVVDNKNLTIRTSIIGPDLNVNGMGLFNWFMKQKDTVSGYKGAIWTGVTTITLAKAVEEAIKQNITGLYHLVNGQSIDKYSLLKLFNDIRSNAININEDISVHVNKSLLNTRSDFYFTVESYEVMVKEIKLWIEKHRDLYSHYMV